MSQAAGTEVRSEAGQLNVTASFGVGGAPHDRAEPLVHGEPTLLEVEIWPTSITLAPGERLRLELLTGDSDLGMMAHDHPALHRPAVDATVHLGGEHASHLLVPVIPG